MAWSCAGAADDISSVRHASSGMQKRGVIPSSRADSRSSYRYKGFIATKRVQRGCAPLGLHLLCAGTGTQEIQAFQRPRISGRLARGRLGARRNAGICATCHLPPSHAGDPHRGIVDVLLNTEQYASMRCVREQAFSFRITFALCAFAGARPTSSRRMDWRGGRDRRYRQAVHGLFMKHLQRCLNTGQAKE